MPQASLSCEELEVQLEIADPDEWTEHAGGWDFSRWDESSEHMMYPALWSDILIAGWHDAKAATRGFVVERGRQSSWDDIQAAHLELELDNTSGTYSVYGSRSYPRIRPGMGVRIYGTYGGIRYPVFIGEMTEYREAQVPEDYAIHLKAVDAFRVLGDPIDVEYHAGTDAQMAGDRIQGLLNRIKYEGPRNIAPGDSTMTNYATTRTILDEIKMTALSDGGLFFMDNDGTAMYLDRDRFTGRAQPPGWSKPNFSDGCGVGELPYAAIEPIIADNEFGNVIMISNVSQGQDSPMTAKSVNVASIEQYGRWLWAPDQLVICNAEYVQSLADWHLARRSTAYYRVNSFECYPVHDDALWPVLLGMRIGDAMQVTRTPPASDVLSAPMLCDGLRIEATPSMWKFVVRCSPGFDVENPAYWDFDVWDDGTWL